MTKNIEEQFNDDLHWMLLELKRDNMANTYSEYQLEFFIEKKSDSEPSEKNQHRIIKMLTDKKIIKSSPIFHRNRDLNKVFEIYGNAPIGYYIKFIQPSFNNAAEEAIKEVETKIDSEWRLLTQRRSLLICRDNDCFLLSKTRFLSENDNFIDSVLAQPGQTIKKEKLGNKASLHAILNNLNITGQIRNLFFEVSTKGIQFKGATKESEFENIGIDIKKLNEEVSKLKKISDKQ